MSALTIGERNKRLSDENKLLRENFPGPECESCECEMELTDNKNYYYCSNCFEGGCTCFNCAPCSYCMHTLDADVWMFGEVEEHSSSKGAKADRNKETLAAARIRCEQGPSAADSAKPVTKLVITCQGDWSPWQENL